MTNIFPIDFEEKNSIANNDFILFSDSEDWNKLKKAQYSNLKWEQGDPGTPWADWAAATITVWSTTTWEPGTSASVVNSWTSSAAVLDFTIPKGAKGDPWQDWDDWAAATITVWTTTTLPAWSSATVTNSWTSSAAVLNFGIPKGDSWAWSGDVNWPASSTDDNIVTFDGATGKLIQDSWISVSALNTQTFTLSSTSDLTNAQKAYNWFQAWNNAIIKYNNILYFYDHSTATNAYRIVANEKVLDQSSYSTWAKDAINLAISSNTVTAITSLQISISDSGFIRVWKNYWTPYTPTNDWSPATKKYVDDSITWITFPVTSVNGQTWAVTVQATLVSWTNIKSVNSNSLLGSWDLTISEFSPWGTATTWYVVTKTADGYEWAAPSGWDVVVSSDSDNVLTTWAGLWVGDENDLPAQPDQNTLYFTY